MSRYTIICTNDACDYKLGFTMNFIPDNIGMCDKCNAELSVISADKLNTTTSAGIVSGVGEIHTRLPSDFRDMMQAIKRGSPGSNMRDFK